MTKVYNMHGQTVRRSKNLAGVLAHYRANPADLVVKVKKGAPGDYSDDRYTVTFYWPHGDSAVTLWADWRVLLDWLKARRSWSISRVTFDAPLYDQHEWSTEFKAFRASGISLNRHAYQS